MLHLADIPGDLPFLDVLAARWLRECRDDPGRGMILLPTRRAARALVEQFVRLTGGRVILLPRITSVAGLDETGLALSGDLDLPPAVDPMLRLAVLSRLILRAGDRFAVAATADQAWALAQSLAGLMDEAERAGTDLGAALPRIAGHQSADWAEHWQITLDFLDIVTSAWPDWLAENGRVNPAARAAALCLGQARAWRAAPPPGPVWAAGFSTAEPSLAELLAGIAKLPEGIVVLAGLDRELDQATFDSLPETHAQSGLSALLAAIGARRDEVADWRIGDRRASAWIPRRRVTALHAALLPEQTLDRWLADPTPAELAGISRLAVSDQQEEAAAIALVLRHAIEVPGHRAALVTPDRALAGRVVVELARFGVLVDDSAGEALVAAPSAVLLRLLAQAAAASLPPVALLSLLKHPCAALGRRGQQCRALARRLEQAVLRGPAPRPGIAGLRAALLAARSARRPLAEQEACALEAFLDDLEAAIAPLQALCAATHRVAVPDLIEALVRSAEAVAATDRMAGGEILWAQEDGRALAAHLEALAEHTASLPPQPAGVLAGLLEASLAGISVRSRRALRGRDIASEHPRIFIWGLLEARLQAVDVAVLGGLVEGVWPPATDPGPWLSRPMRLQAGLPSAEAAIGQSAHDFLASCCCAGEIVLSHPARRDGAPSVPARWLVRLDAWLRGRGQVLAEHPALGWLARLDQPEGAPRPVAAPRPKPPVTLRPRRLSVTEIETWMLDPYAIHARHVLRLDAMRPLEESADAADYGTIVHDALHRFVQAHGASWPVDAAAMLRRQFDASLDAAGLRPALAAWWRPRLLRIAAWVAETDSAHRAALAPRLIGTETDGRAVISGLAGGDFILRGRADRIETLPDGTLSLLDYKTGILPAAKDVREGWSSQLVLEAAMARLGGFGPAFHGETSALAYWRLTGDQEGGQVRQPARPDELRALVEGCWASLTALVIAYDNPDQPYLSHPRAGAPPRFADYAGLARVAEWSAAREEAG